MFTEFLLISKFLCNLDLTNCSFAMSIKLGRKLTCTKFHYSPSLSVDTCFLYFQSILLLSKKAVMEKERVGKVI